MEKQQLRDAIDQGKSEINYKDLCSCGMCLSMRLVFAAAESVLAGVPCAAVYRGGDVSYTAIDVGDAQMIVADNPFKLEPDVGADGFIVKVP